MTAEATQAAQLKALERWPHLARIASGYVDRIVALPESEREKFWFWSFVTKAARPEKATLLGEWDRAAEAVCTHERDFAALHGKIERALPKSASAHRPEYDDQFRDAIVEMLGYHLFWQKGVRLHFIPEGPQASPDMANGAVVVECKNFHSSQDDRAYFEAEEVEARTVWNVFAWDKGNPFLAKILKTVDEQVLPKFTDYPTHRYRRYLFANFRLDIVAVAVEEQSPEDKLAFFRRLGEVLRREWSIELVAIEKYALQNRLV